MTTLRDMERAARVTLVPWLLDHGFAKRGHFNFVRERGEFFDVLMSEILSSGETLRMYATCWSPAVDLNVDLKKLPRWVGVLTGNEVHTGFPDQGGVWDVKDQPNIDKAIDGLRVCIERAVLPWFASIVSIDDFLEAVDINLKERPSWESRVVEIRAAFAALSGKSGPGKSGISSEPDHQ